MVKAGGDSEWIHAVTRWYARAVIAGFTLSPLGLVAYLAFFQDPSLRFENHAFHVLAIAVATVEGAFVSYVSWRCYAHSGEPFLRWLTLGFVGFTVIYALHGALTPLAHHNVWLFILYGPASRVVMAGCFLAAVLAWGRPADPVEVRRQLGFWLGWGGFFMAINVAVAVLAESPIAGDLIVRTSIEGAALCLCLVAAATMLVKQVAVPLMRVYLIALTLFAESSFAFVLGRVWNHQWWLAHVIFAGGFFLLSYGVVRAFLTTRSFSTVYGEEQLMAELAARERQYRLLAENVRDLIVTVDLNGVRRYVSPASLTLYGYRPEELIGKRSVDLAHPDDAPKLAAAFAEMAAGRDEGSVLVRAVRKDGSLRWVDISLRLIRDAETGAPAEIIGVLRDAEERVAAEAALRASEEQFRIITENAGDLIITVGRDGKRRYVSPSHRRILGFEPDELLNNPRASLMHPDDREEFGSSFDSMFGDNPIPKVIGRAIHRDGRIVWLEAHHTLVTDPVTGEPVETVSIIRDITAQKLAAEQVEAARQEAEQANRVKSDFLASMSHEIRTPMNGVIGFATLMLGTELTPKQQRMMTLLKESGEALLAIINDILDLSKIEAGHLELESIPVDLRDLAHGTASIIEPLATAKRLGVNVVVDRAVPQFVSGDPTRLRQVLLNFLSNAVKFTAHGGVLIRIRPEGGGSTRLVFDVEDTGIGILKERQHLLFRAFSQIDRSTTRKFGGTGLGLAISKQLVEAMPQGEIGVVSVPGDGSVFWFAVDLPACAAPAAVSGKVVPIATRRARILVAEDVYINQVIIEEMLLRAGHTVVLVDDGAAAVAMLQERDFDLVLMDVQMPVMDGLEATAAIRAGGGRNREVPIVALTANALVEEPARCRAVGMSDFLTKPIVYSALHETIAKWIGTESPGEPASARDQGDGAVLNDTVLLDLENRLGRDRVDLLVTMAEEQIVRSQAAMEAAAADRDVLGREAHILISLAGNMGLVELAALSRTISEFLRSVAATDEQVVARGALLRAAAERALAALERRRARNESEAERLIRDAG